MKEKEFPVLETERLILREVKPEDAPSVFHYLSDMEVMKYYGMSPMSDVSEAVEEIDWYRRIFDRRDRNPLGDSDKRYVRSHWKLWFSSIRGTSCKSRSGR